MDFNSFFGVRIICREVENALRHTIEPATSTLRRRAPCITGRQRPHLKKDNFRGTMSYVDNNLLPHEQVVYRANLHWMIYGPAAIVSVLALLVLVSSIGGRSGGIASFGGLLLLIGLVMFFFRWIAVRTSEFAVTSKRVVIKVGLVRRHSLELLLRQVEGIGVDQGIVGRIFGYGTITVAGTGGTKEPFRGIANPLEFRRQVQTLSAA